VAALWNGEERQLVTVVSGGVAMTTTKEKAMTVSGAAAMMTLAHLKISAA
jgi:hypothetical protein